MAAPLRILTVVGARPQFIKAAALGRSIAGPFAGRLEQTVLHTGQHFDAGMSDVFFTELGMQRPDVHIPTDPQRASYIGRMMTGVEQQLQRERPDVVLVYGDTNSTLAGAMVACRMGIPVAHVEAGLRSYDSSMPEEENRVLADHASTWLFCPTATAVANLEKESILNRVGEQPTLRSPSVTMVGDVMFDNTLHYAAIARSRSTVDELGLRGRAYAVATVHRAGTSDDPVTLREVFGAFGELYRATGMEVIVPLHPRTAKTLATMPANTWEGVRIVQPMGYLDLLALVDASRLVVTDSGGLQKEACFLEKHCLILRDRTEWVELLGRGGSVLVGTDKERIVPEALRVLKEEEVPAPDAFGDGHAAEHICNELLKYA